MANAAKQQTQDPEALRRSIEAAKRLREQIVGMAGDDEQAIQDTFDGETTLDEELRRALLAEDEDRILIDGIKVREDALSQRRNRAERRIEARRGLIEQAMAVSGWAKHVMDIGTISLGKASPRVEIDDEANIPSQFFKAPPPPEPVLDKKGLRDALIERHTKLAEIGPESPQRAKIDTEFPEIPGCHLETGGVQISIRRK